MRNSTAIRSSFDGPVAHNSSPMSKSTLSVLSSGSATCMLKDTITNRGSVSKLLPPRKRSSIAHPGSLILCLASGL